MKPSPELQQLITDTKKQLEHLRILGVENIRLDVAPVSAPALNVKRPGGDPGAGIKTRTENPVALFQDFAQSPEKLTPSTETFEQIHAEIGDCTRCPLHL